MKAPDSTPRNWRGVRPSYRIRPPFVGMLAAPIPLPQPFPDNSAGNQPNLCGDKPDGETDPERCRNEVAEEQNWGHHSEPADQRTVKGVLQTAQPPADICRYDSMTDTDSLVLLSPGCWIRARFLPAPSEPCDTNRAGHPHTEPVVAWPSPGSGVLPAARLSTVAGNSHGALS